MLNSTTDDLVYLPGGGVLEIPKVLASLALVSYK